MQTTSEYVLKCDFCKHIMLQVSCKLSVVVVKIVVTDSSLLSENNDIHLALFHNELVKLLKTEVFDEQFVSSSLFELQNLKSTFESKRNIVMNIEEL